MSTFVDLCILPVLCYLAFLSKHLSLYVMYCIHAHTMHMLCILEVVVCLHITSDFIHVRKSRRRWNKEWSMDKWSLLSGDMQCCGSLCRQGIRTPTWFCWRTWTGMQMQHLHSLSYVIQWHSVVRVTSEGPNPSSILSFTKWLGIDVWVCVSLITVYC